MRALWTATILLTLAAPAAALAQSGESALGGQATAVQLTRQQALQDVERAGYTSVSKLVLGPDGSWTAMTAKGAVKVNAAGQVSKTE
jgi:hypothetical protein